MQTRRLVLSAAKPNIRTPVLGFARMKPGLSPTYVRGAARMASTIA